MAEGDEDPRRIGREADVDLLLAGSTLWDGERLRVSVELVEAPTATVVGSYVCQAAWDKIFDVQDSVVRRVVELLAPELTDHERRTLRRDVPASARAYEFYLRGVHLETRTNFQTTFRWRETYTFSPSTRIPITPRRGRAWGAVTGFSKSSVRRALIARS